MPPARTCDAAPVLTMLKRPYYVTEDPEIVKRLIRENPWATFISATTNGVVASHYPILLEEDAEGISVVSHMGRPDDETHEVGQHELLIIVQGPHGYISPSWYIPSEFIPTWNHVTAHLYGQPEILAPEENLRVLHRLTDHFEAGVPEPRSLLQDPEITQRTARGTTGIRLRVTRFQALLKLSQNKTPEVIERITDELDHGSAYRNRRLAREMRLVHGQS